MTMAQRRELYEDIGRVSEVAELLDVPIERVRRWIANKESNNCPEPVRVFRGLTLYSLAEWKGWYALWRLTKGTGVARFRKY